MGFQQSETARLAAARSGGQFLFPASWRGQPSSLAAKPAEKAEKSKHIAAQLKNPDSGPWARTAKRVGQNGVGQNGVGQNGLVSAHPILAHPFLLDPRDRAALLSASRRMDGRDRTLEAVPAVRSAITYETANRIWNG